MNLTIYIDNDSEVRLESLIDAAGEYQNAATVEITLQSSEGVDIDNQSWPLMLNYVEDSNGDYSASLSKNLSFYDKQSVLAIVNVVSGGLHAHWEEYVVAQTRRFKK